MCANLNILTFQSHETIVKLFVIHAYSTGNINKYHCNTICCTCIFNWKYLQICFKISVYANNIKHITSLSDTLKFKFNTKYCTIQKIHINTYVDRFTSRPLASWWQRRQSYSRHSTKNRKLLNRDKVGVFFDVEKWVSSASK